ncbi:hypothetical protein Tco_0933177, partial [Tanacetum coccineum]
FVQTAVLTRSGRIPVSIAKQYVNSATRKNRGNPQQALKYKGMFDSGCSKHMTGNKALLTDYQDIDGGFVAFGRIDGQTIAITEASIRRHLQLADADGISSLPNTKIFEQLILMSPKKTSWEQFSSNIATAIICLATNRTFKFSKLIFDGMVKNVDGVHIPLFDSMLVHDQPGQGEGPSSPGGTQHTSTLIETSPQLQNISNAYRKTRTRTRRVGIRIPQSDVPSSVTNEAIINEMHDGLVRATTTASSLEAEQGSGNISKTQTKATSEGGPGYHFTMGDIPVQARPERVSNLPNKPPLREGNTSQSREGSMQLLELINLYTKLSNKVTSLEDELA